MVKQNYVTILATRAALAAQARTPNHEQPLSWLNYRNRTRTQQWRARFDGAEPPQIVLLDAEV